MNQEDPGCCYEELRPLDYLPICSFLGLRYHRGALRAIRLAIPHEGFAAITNPYRHR